MPMSTIKQVLNNRLATALETNRYQQKIRSLLFAAVTTQPNIAFATLRLARFLVNLSHKYYKAADRVLLYLHATKTKALQLGQGTGLEVASNASFADNTIDRKSSQGYVIKLFRGLIAQRASKQDTVTTSTTKAKLLALSQVAKEALYLTRLLKELQITVPRLAINISCDNKQIIRLVTKDVAKLQTKLQHVDIYNYQLQQEVSRDKIKVLYVSTNQMIADGLTKSLPANTQETFLNQLGLVERRPVHLKEVQIDKIKA